MSNSVDTSPTIRPVKRRRSSLMTRKSIAPVVVSQTQEVALRQYVTEANHEIQEWTSLGKQRHSYMKTADAALKEAISNPPTFTLESVKGDLTKDDLEFIANQPDYRQFSSDVKTFAETVAHLKTSIDSANSLINSNNFLGQSRLDAIAKNVCMFNEKTTVWHTKGKE